VKSFIKPYTAKEFGDKPGQRFWGLYKVIKSSNVRLEELTLRRSIAYQIYNGSIARNSLPIIMAGAATELQEVIC